MQRLADVLHFEHESSSAGQLKEANVFTAQLEGQLSCLLDAAQHLDQFLLTCVDDVVLLHSRWDQQQHDMEGVHAALLSLRETRHQREAQYAQELTKARSSGEEAERQRAATAEELASANAIIEELKEKLQQCADTLRMQTQKAQQTAHARGAEVQRVREATRRSSAAEHAADISARQEAQWRTRLAAVEAQRDALTEECAVMKGRLEVRQTREHITNSCEHQQSLPSSASFLAEARHQQRALLRSSVSAPVTTSIKPIIMDEKTTSSPKPHHVRILDEDGADRLDEHAEAFPSTPRRSLSYSPPESAKRLVPVSARSPSNGTRASSSSSSSGGGGLGVRPRSYPDRRTEPLREANVLSSTPRPSSQPPPVNVVQPSAFAQGHTLCGEQVKAVKHGDSSASLNADNSSTPLARMRAWEEKFTSILATS